MTADEMANSEELQLRLVPRIRLDFSMIKVGDMGGGMPLGGSGFGFGRWPYGSVTASSCAYVLEDIPWAVPKLYKNPDVKLPRSDIHVHDVVPPRYDPSYNKYDIFSVPRSEIGRGFLFFRDLNFVGINNGDIDSEELQRKLRKGRQFLLDKLDPFTLSYPTQETKFQIWACEPVSEDPLRMLSLLAHHTRGSTVPHTIIVKGLPCKWFEQPGSSEPSKDLLRLFFKKFGEVRDLDISVDDKKATCCNVSVLYENYEGCCNALNNLCSFSLQKGGDSSMTADYEVAWKDYKPLERVNFPFDGERELQALQRRKEELKEELKVVRKKMDAIEAYKGSSSYSSKNRKKYYSSSDSKKRKDSPYYPSKSRGSSYRSEKRGNSSYYSKARW